MTKYTLKLCEAYTRVEKKLLKEYPLAKDSFSDKYDEIISNPGLDDVYPGFVDCEIHKGRIGVPKLRMSKREGFRIIYLVGSKKIAPVYIYKKGKPEREDKIKARVHELLEEILIELSSTQ